MELSKLSDYLDMIFDQKMVIPNFQRRYEWNEKQVKYLIASYLFGLKIGTTLIYEPKNGGDLPYLLFDNENVQQCGGNEQLRYVVDGQQRLTSTLIAFTNYYDSNNIKLSRSNKHFKKYYLKIPMSSDFLGLNTLKFRSPSIDDYSFYEEVAGEYIQSYSKSNKTPQREGGFYTPILLDDLRDKENLYTLLHKISYESIEQMSEERREELLANGDKDRFVWVSSVIEYFNNIMNSEMLSIKIKSTLYEAIMTYQLMNKTGKALSDLDILASQYSTVNETERLYRVIEEYLSKVISNKKLKIIDERRLIEKTENQYMDQLNEKKVNWNFYDYMIRNKKDKPVNPEVPKAVLDQMCKLLKFASISYDYKYSINSYKTSEILTISGDEINKHLSNVLESISLAGAFLQIRCGLVNIDKLEHNWMLFVIAALFIEKTKFSNEDLKIIELWYFTSRFTGRYRNDQNQKALRDLEMLTKWMTTGVEHKEIKDLFEDLNSANRKTEALSEKIILHKDQFSYPKKVSSYVVCEFAAKDGYISKIHNNELITVFTSIYTGDNDYYLEFDHIWPLKFDTIFSSDQTIALRKNKKHIFNSPMNMAYLTRKENSVKGETTPLIFSSRLDDTYKVRTSLDSIGVSLKESIQERYKTYYLRVYSEMKKII
ncbi:DUF262 domain-containing protein [Mycoplasmatota bacterium zrk1]